jgi:hypothetical protein
MAPPVGAGLADSLHINEIHHNPEGTDGPNEYVELRGMPGATIPANTYLVFIEGDTGSPNPGDVNSVFDLAGLTLGSNGFLVLLQRLSPYTPNPAAAVVTGTGTGFGGAAGWQADSGATDIENESFTAMLVTAPTAPLPITDIDANNDGTPDGTAYQSWTILDAVASLDPLTDVGYAAAKFFDAEWLGRPTGDPSGLAQDDWVGSAFANGTPLPPAATLSESTAPASYSGFGLDHLGGPNWPAPEPVIPEAPVAIVLPLGGAAVLGGYVVLRQRRLA